MTMLWSSRRRSAADRADNGREVDAAPDEGAPESGREATASPGTLQGIAPPVGPLVAVEDLHVTFDRNGREVRALRGVSLEIQPGEILGLVGESGSGKSILGLTLLGLLPNRPAPQVSGRVGVCGTDMVSASSEERRLSRRQH